MLLFSGYLTSLESRREQDRLVHRLVLPNREVRLAFEDAIIGWTERALAGRAALDAMLAAMLRGEGEEFEKILAAFVRDVLSHHDVDRRQPERVFHAFVLGMLVQLQPRWRVRSNREAGHGRADILIVAAEHGGTGVVLELKVVDAERGETPEAALDAALAQIDARGYEAELRAEGAGEVRVYAAAFDGKRAWVRGG